MKSEEEPKKYKFDPELCLERHKAGLDAMQRQLKAEDSDIDFQIPENQWDPDARAARQGVMSGRPARPILSISKIQQPQQLIKNQVTSSHLGVEVHPLSEDAKNDTAKVIQGLYRKIQRDSKANQARMWAFDRAVICGSGVYEIATEYDDSAGNEFDQKIVINRVLYQDQVVWDPAAMKPDFSDGEFGFLDSWMSLSQFKRDFPKATVSTVDKFDLSNVGRTCPGWIDFDNKQRGVRVSKYFCKHHETVKVEGVDPDTGEKISRDKDVVTVYWHLVAPGVDGVEELVGDKWNGKYIPLIPVIGIELQMSKSSAGERRRIGVTTNAKDAQRLYNYAATSATEMALLETKAPWMGAEGTFEGHRQKWDTANTQNWSTLEYKPVEFKGQIMPPPQRIQSDMGRLGPSLALLDKADTFIQAMTYSPDATLGQLDPAHRSGKALQTLVGQSEASSSNYANNLVEISMPYEATVILDLIPAIYDRPGRLTHILDFEDKSEEVILNAPFVMDPNTGRPVMVSGAPDAPQMPPGAPNMPQMGGPGPGAPNAPGGGPIPVSSPKPKMYDLREGVYGTTISIGKSYKSRLEAGQDKLGQLLQADPELMPLLGSIFFKFSDDPWAKEASKIMEKVRDVKYPFLAGGVGDEETPDQLKGKLQAATAQVQQMQQQLQQASQVIEGEKVKQEVQLQIAKMNNETKLQVAEIQASVKETTSKLDAIMSIVLDRSKASQAAFDRRHAAQLGHDQMSHELGMDAVSKGHERDLQQEDMAHELGLTAVGQGHAQDMSQVGHSQALDQMSQQSEIESASENQSE